MEFVNYASLFTLLYIRNVLTQNKIKIKIKFTLINIKYQVKILECCHTLLTIFEVNGTIPRLP